MMKYVIYLFCFVFLFSACTPNKRDVSNMSLEEIKVLYEKGDITQNELNEAFNREAIYNRMMEEYNSSAKASNKENEDRGNYRLSDMSIRYTYVFNGKVNNEDEFWMTLYVDSTSVHAKYISEDGEMKMSFNGSLIDNKLSLEENLDAGNEQMDKNMIEGVFSLEEGKIKGTWSYKVESVPFEMKDYMGAEYLKHTFKSNFDISNENYMKEINVVHIYNKEGECFQVLDGFEAQSYNNNIALVDINFDGYQDIELLETIGNFSTHIYWIYAPDDGIYEKSDIMEELSSEKTIDYKNKTAAINWHRGNYSGYSSYIFQNGEYFMSETYSHDEVYDEDEEMISVVDETVNYVVVRNKSRENSKTIKSFHCKTNETIITSYRKDGDKWVEIN